jgi:hypothetical protein
MDLIPIPWIIGLFALGIAGLFMRNTILRIICWILAAPPLAVGCLALYQGGIVEPFSSNQLLTFCGLAFTPTVGCVIGEFIAFRKRRNK